MSKRYLLSLSFGLLLTCSHAQDGLDSLKALLKTARTPADQFRITVALLEAGDVVYGTNLDSSACASLLRIAQQQGDEGMLATSYNWIGYLLNQKGDYPSAMEYYFKALPLAEKVDDKRRISSLYFDIAGTYSSLRNYTEFFNYTLKGGQNLPEPSAPKYHYMLFQYQRNMAGHFIRENQMDSASEYSRRAEVTAAKLDIPVFLYQTFVLSAFIQTKLAKTELAEVYFKKALGLSGLLKSRPRMVTYYNRYIPYLFSVNRIPEASRQTQQFWEIARQTDNPNIKLRAAGLKRELFEMLHQPDSAYFYLKLETTLKDQIFNQNDQNLIQSLAIKNQLRGIEEEGRKQASRTRTTLYILAISLGVFSIFVFFLYRNNLMRKKANLLLQQQKEKVEQALIELKSTQTLLIQSEKMASLGELTAGIAHEIQNPLNFVNNFSELNNELLQEMEAEIGKSNWSEARAIARRISENEEKIVHHGKRADSIVKGMLQHSRLSSVVKEPTNINKLADEYLRLTFHGLRAKDKSFNARFETHFEEGLANIRIVPQDMGRVILNLVQNAFYAVSEKSKTAGAGHYEPTVTVSTRSAKDKVEIVVKDNGNGIPQKVQDKIFQPFFTTKPTGQGTGLGLSLSYDIVKSHGGEIRVETTEGEGTVFIISLPIG